MASFALSLAVGLATNYVISLLTPSQERRQEQSQRDIRGPKTGFDQPIAKIYGQARVGCGFLWATPIRTVTIEETQSSGGGKGGGGGSSTTTTISYEYYADFACWVCQGEVNLKRIWMNGDVVWVDSGNKKIDVSHYTGSETQTPDSTIQSVEGSADTPPFKGLAYFVVENALLNDFNSSFPQVIEAEVEAIDFANPSLQQVVEDVCDRAGLDASEYDASDLSGINILGAILKNDGGSYRNFLEELQQVYFFLPIYSNGKIKFIRQRQPNTTTLIKKDLSPKGWLLTTEARQDIPYEIQLSYYNRSDSYQRAVQYSRRQGRRDNVLRIETSLTLYDGKAKSIVDQIQTQFWQQRRKYTKLELLPAWLGLEPGMVITLPNNQQIQISDFTIGANLAIEFEGTQYKTQGLDIIDDIPSSEGEYEYRPPNDPVDFGVAEAIPFEAPIRSLGDPESCIYVFIKAPPELISGGLLVSENNSDFTLAKEIAGRTTFGVAETDISSAILPNQWDGTELIDTSTVIRVVLEQGELNSVPVSGFDDNKRVLLIGGEYVGFRDATLISDKTYDVSYLKRGIRGTERAIAQHSPNEQAILVRGEQGGRTIAVQGTPNQIRKTLYFKAVASGQDPSAVSAFSLAVQGISLKPFAPVSIRMTTEGNDALIFSWVARSRGVAYTLGETSEEYELEIFKNGNVVRTLFSDEARVTYLDYEQVADFNSTISSIEEIRLYKISSIVGRGFPAVVEDIQIVFAESSSGEIGLGGSSEESSDVAESSSDAIRFGGSSTESFPESSSSAIGLGGSGEGIVKVVESSSGAIGFGGNSSEPIVTLSIIESSNGAIGLGGSSSEAVVNWLTTESSSDAIRFGGNSSESIVTLSIIESSSGAIGLGGSSSDVTITFSSGNVYTASYDGFVNKTDSNGNSVWSDSSSFSGSLTDLASDSSHVYVMTSAVNVYKINQSGTPIWTYSYSSIYPNAEAISVDSNGNVYSAVQRLFGNGDRSPNLDKIDNTGNFEWNILEPRDSYYPFINDIAVNTNNKIYLARDDSYLAQFSPTPFFYWEVQITGFSSSINYVAANVDALIAIRDHVFLIEESTGNELWRKEIGPSETVTAVAIDDSDISYVGTQVPELVKLDSSGNEIWRISISGSGASFDRIPRCIAIDNVGDKIYVGLANGTIHKYDASGNLIWSRASHSNVIIAIEFIG